MVADAKVSSAREATLDAQVTVRTSVIVPAHNEAAVLSRCLTSLADGLAPDAQIIVVCNGCEDNSADIARDHPSAPVVIEHPVASKIDALNLGDDQASGPIRCYVDADVEVSGRVIGHVADVLESDVVLCAAPTPSFVTADRPWAVRAFYRVWEQIPYIKDNMVGSGFYALSQTGRRRFDRFPRVTGDDKFVLELFRTDERLALSEDTFLVHTPTTVRGLLAMRKRVYRGNLELDRMVELGDSRSDRRPERANETLRHLAHDPGWIPAVALYVLVNTWARLLARRRWDGVWERDQSARQDARPGSR